MSKKIILIIGFILLLVVGYIVYRVFNKDSKPTKNKTELERLIEKKIDKDKLLSISYSNSGNMSGNIYTVDFNIDSMIITESKSDAHNEPITIKEYKVNENDKDKLIEYINKYNIPAWYDLPDLDYRIYDAPTRVFKFYYDNTNIDGNKLKSYNIYFDKKMNEETSKVLVEFRDYYLTLLKEENKIKEYNKNR